MDPHLIRAIRDQRSGKPFRAVEIDLDDRLASMFVRLRFNPGAFSKKIFSGEWGDPSVTPEPSSIRLLTAIVDKGGVLRLVGRQEKNLYVLSIEQNEDIETI